MKRPKIGVSVQIFWDYNKLDLDYAINHSVNDLGFECVEILCQNPMYGGWGTSKAKETTRKIKDILSTLDAEVSIHAPYHDLNIASWNVRISEETVRQINESIDVATKLNSEIVVAHSGYMSSRKYRKDKTFDIMLQNFAKIAKHAEDSGVTLCMENIASKPKALGTHIADIKRIFNTVNSKNFKLCLDAAHANTTGLKPKEFAVRLKEYVRHVHLSDNTGNNEHLPVGMGNINFKDFLYALKPYYGFLIIEGWTPHNEDYFLEWDRNRIGETLDNIYGKRKLLKKRK